MAALLVALSVMGVLMSMALPVWTTAARREKEAELIFRGEQYARAVTLFQQRYGGAFPPDVDVLVTDRLLRKRYLDPITGKEFEIITPASAIAGSAVPGGTGGPLAGAGSARGTARTGGAGAQQGGAAAGRGTAATQARPAAQTAVQRGRGAGAGQVGASAGVLGVRSTSTERSFRVYNGAETYDQWLFIGTQSSPVAGGGAVGADTPGGPGDGRGGAADGRGGRGGRGGEGAEAGPGGRGFREGGGGGGGFRQGGGGRGGRGF